MKCESMATSVNYVFILEVFSSLFNVLVSLHVCIAIAKAVYCF